MNLHPTIHAGTRVRLSTEECEYGTGTVIRTTSDIDGVTIVFVRWDDCRKHGVAGGWYDPIKLRVEESSPC